MNEIHRYLEKYSDIHPGAIVKEDLLRLGVGFDGDVTLRLDVYLNKQYNLFTSNYNRGSEGGPRTPKVPHEFRISNERLGILPTVVETRHSAATPYKISWSDGKFVLNAYGEYLADVEFQPRPPYHDKVFPDGTRYENVVALVHWGYKVAASVVRHCDYSTSLCKFCDINSNHKLRKDGAVLNSDPYAKLDYVVPVIKEILENTQLPGTRALVYGLTGGTMLRENGESFEADVYASYIKRIKQQVGGRYPVSVTCTARTEDELWKLKEAGLDVYQSNIEVWDKNIFSQVCPGKEAHIGYDRWVDLLKKAVNIFGEGNVITNFVAGVELSHRYGFKTMDEALASTTGGFDYLMHHGITPKMTSWCASAGSSLKNEPILPLDYYVRVANDWYGLWKKHCLPPIRNHGPMGPGRAIEINSSYNDIGS